MTCKLGDQQPDWKAYAFGELSAQERREAEAHAETCVACQEEMAGLRVTLDAMATLREEEMPRRIAFVSDKVFEPNWFQRAWQGMARPSFAGAALVAIAIVVHAFVWSVSTPVASVDNAVVEARVQDAVNQALNQEVEKKVAARLNAAMDQAVNEAVSQAVNQAVAKAVADTEKRNAEQTARLLAAAERRYEDTATFLSRQVTQMYAVNTGLGVR
jgi:hypothetical protein